MKIKRGEVEIELTGAEMISAWLEVEKWNKIEELENAMPEKMSAVEKRKKALEALPLYEKAFDWNDSHYDNLKFALNEIGIDF